jgi:hypothetical protein
VSLWLARVMTVGPTHSGTRFLGARFVQHVASLLLHTPVGFVARGSELVHPASDAAAIADCRVGYVARNWYDASTMSLLAILEIESARIHRGLVRHERTRRLHTVGVSLLFAGEPVTRDLGPHCVEYVHVDGILSCDLVSSPAGVGCHVLRSIKEESCSS